MATVWKVGSRWNDINGKPESSIISIFRRNNVVFVGEEKAREVFLKEVKPGDYFAIADGFVIAAVAKVIDHPTTINNLKINTIEAEKTRFDYDIEKDWAIGVRVKIVDLKLEGDEIITYKKRGTLFKANSEISEKVIKLYEGQNSKFSINSYTCTLMESKGYYSVFDSSTRFIIPVYQRPYSWGEKEIKPFISDLINNYLGKDRKGENPEPMFIGTMQLSEKKYISKDEHEQEVIDGQQRLTTLSILLKLLSIKYPDFKRLNDLKFNWLESRINKSQNDYLTDFFNTNIIEERANNTYFNNAVLIENSFNNLIENEIVDENNSFSFDIDKFCDYLFSKVYFVIIETYTGLSKTLQIFNAINTTGLDLNGGDLFKIRMYEYLKDIKNEDESAFNKISEIYELIDEKNKHVGRHVTHIQEILDIYKDILIAKYGLPDVLFQFGWDTFYERLFDVILGIKEWEYFNKAHEKEFEILLEEIKNVVNIRFEWENASFVSVENMFAYKFICWSRYSRYWKIVYLFLYKNRDDKDRYHKLSELLIKLNKIFIIYSIIYAKSVYEMHAQMYKIQKCIINNDFEEVINLTNSILLSSENSYYDKVKGVLEGIITDNAKKKVIICSLSAYLDEANISNEITTISKKIFDTRFDIEHILSQADERFEVDETLRNSIGNLVLLEEAINRSIQDAPYVSSDDQEKSKKKEYKRSKFVSVQNIANNDKWDEENIKLRRSTEVEKIMQYIFNK